MILILTILFGLIVLFATTFWYDRAKSPRQFGGWGHRSKPSVRAESPSVPKPTPETVLSPEPTDGLTCFTRGLLVSVIKHSDDWRYSDLRNGLPCYHHSSGVVIEHYTPAFTGAPAEPAWTRINNADLPDDQQVIAARLWRILEMHRSEKAKAETAARIATTRAPFERLGCPDTSQDYLKITPAG